jgi:hypothetical protein
VNILFIENEVYVTLTLKRDEKMQKTPHVKVLVLRYIYLFSSTRSKSAHITLKAAEPFRTLNLSRVKIK